MCCTNARRREISIATVYDAMYMIGFQVILEMTIDR